MNEFIIINKRAFLAEPITAMKNIKTKLTIIECKSGMWVAYFDNSSNVISNGSSLQEALDNLKLMLAGILNEGYKFCFAHPTYS